MKRNHVVRTFALLIIAGSVVALAEGRIPLASRVRDLVDNLIGTASAAGRVSRLQATGERITAQRAEGQMISLSLRAEATTVPTEYAAGAGVGELAGGARAQTLASADFDEDGTPDLVGGYAGAGGAGVITLQRGNVDAIYPHSPEAQGRRERGQFTDAPFHREASAFRLPEAAHFVGAGDFDADGHWDVVAARRGGHALYFLRGNGRGALSEAERIDLPGAVTAFATGEVNRRDGLTEVIVGVTGDAGAGVLVFESPTGALRGQPERISLATAASGLAIGVVDADLSSGDLVIAAGHELLIVYGRDRRLSLDAQSRAGVREARVSRSTFEFTLESVAIGDFAGDERTDVAVLSGDGAVHVLTRDGRQTNEARAERARTEATSKIDWQSSEQRIARVAESRSQEAETANLLATANVSTPAKDDLLALVGGRVHVIANEAQSAGSVEAQRETKHDGEPEAMRVVASFNSESAGGGVAAALPMRLNSSASSGLVMIGASSAAPSVALPEARVTFTVNSTADTGDAGAGFTSDSVCADANGNCTLRAALDEIGANASDPNAGPYAINFNIPGAGVPTISTSGNFPGQNAIRRPVVIDGTTQAAGRVEIIDTAGHSGLFRIFGGNSTVRGLVMSGSGEGSIWLRSDNNIIEGCYFSTNADGTAAATRRNQSSLYIASSNNRIGGTTAAARNVISGSTTFGIQIDAGTGNLIQGNYIGTNAAGTGAIGNRIAGIRTAAPGVTIGGTTAGAGNLISGNENGGGEAALSVRNGGSGIAFVTVQGNLFGTNATGDARIANGGDALGIFSGGGVTTIGGASPAARNIISGNGGRGIYISACCDPNFVPSAYIQGNHIGTNADGTFALPNLGNGITLDRANITVGGAVSGAGNLISGNGADGINISGFFGSPGHIIQGNLIGTDRSGTLALPNQGDGIETFRADATLIGGTTPEARNTISGNRENGLLLQPIDNPSNSSNRVRVQGNYIGTNRFGTGALGNGRNGVYFFLNSFGYDIGGTGAGAGNLIAHNAESGIASERNFIGGATLSNSIHSNGELGIDISDNGVSPDSAVFPGGYRPALTSVTNTEAGTAITGTIFNHNASTPYTIQFFSNPSCDPSGHGEGQTLIGQTTFTPSAQNTILNFSHTVSPAAPGGSFITAVAVRAPDANQPADFYTSEFSNCAQLAAPPPTPTPTPTATPTPTPAPLRLFVIAPARAGDAAAVTRQITGQGIQAGATVRLTRAGQPDIAGAGVSVMNNGTTLSATFDLRGKARGVWSVVVTNPDGGTATLADAFTIGEARRANVWVDVLGRFTVRAGLTQRFFIAYGNTGQVDSEPTMFRVYIPFGVTIAELPALPDGSRPAVYQTVTDTILEFYAPTVAAESSTHIPIRLTVRPNLAHQTVRLRGMAISSPLLRAATDLQVNPSVRVTSEIVEQTDTLRRTVHHVTSSSASYDVVDEVTVTNDTQNRLVSAQVNRGNGSTQYVTGYTIPVGITSARPAPTPPPPPGGSGLALTSVSPRRGAGGFVTVTIHGQNIHPQARARLTRAGQPDIVAADLSVATNRLSALVAFNLTNRALGVWNVVVTNPDGASATLPDAYTIDATYRRVTQRRTLADGSAVHEYGPDVINTYRGKAVQRALEAAGRARSSVLDDSFQPITASTAAQGVTTDTSLSTLFGTVELFDFGEINASVLALFDTRRARGEDIFTPFDLTPRREPEPGTPPPDPLPELFPEPFETITISPLIILEVVFAFDPNDKVGSVGAGAQRYIPGTAAMPYTIFFENKPDATAPAQEVVITDQLDAARFDFSTFQLGPVTFGNRVVTPPPGLSQWTTDVDLRPANNLIVRVNAGLNHTTGLVTWRFTSLDPATGLPTDDPRAGFLPPNRASPEGEGSVLFTVTLKEAFPAGTEVRNSARIVFDANAPIDTPTWLNTIDNSRPSSQVAALAAIQQSTRFEVQWSGTDTGAGIQSYTIFVSENGGPYTVWLSNTTAASDFFVGQPGKTYSFYSVALDGAGNGEESSASAEATTRTPVTAVQFETARVRVNEGAGRATLTITRTGDTGSATSLSYATSDAAGNLRCAEVNGAASARCDYSAISDTINFASGQSSRTVTIFITDDAYAESAETFTVRLSNVAGGGLGAPFTATVEIEDNDSTNGATNPIDNVEFFVRQHYLDFLNREADPDGLNFWTSQITSCGADAQCVEIRRINVSAAFFLSIEFQETSYLAYRIYQAAYGNLAGKPIPIRRDELLPDTQAISGNVRVGIGNWEQQLEANKAAFVNQFVTRPRFNAAYPAGMTPAQFVDQLNANAGGALSQAERDALVADLVSGAKSRAQALRAVAEDETLRRAEFNEAFVLTQYFGYLRRDPDAAGFNGQPDPNFDGYNFWLAKLNQFGGDFVRAEMVKAFIQSIEYRQRFGQ